MAIGLRATASMSAPASSRARTEPSEPMNAASWMAVKPSVPWRCGQRRMAPLGPGATGKPATPVHNGVTACESCHNTRHWRLTRFDHQTQTRYPLDGRHANVRCEDCHRQPAPPGRPTAPLGTDCATCHRGDDPHDGGFGPRCEQCHQTSDWRALSPRRPPPPPATASGVRR